MLARLWVRDISLRIASSVVFLFLLSHPSVHAANACAPAAVVVAGLLYVVVLYVFVVEG